MSSVYAPVAATLPGGVTIPADGTDYVSASSVNVPLCAALDGIAYNRAKYRRYYNGSSTETYSPLGTAITGTSFADVDLLGSVAAAVGETVNFRYHGQVLAPVMGVLMLALGPSRLPVANGAYTIVTTETGYTIVGSTTIVAGHLSAGTLNIYLQGRRPGASGTVTAYTPHWLEVEIIKP